CLARRGAQLPPTRCTTPCGTASPSQSETRPRAGSARSVGGRWPRRRSACRLSAPRAASTASVRWGTAFATSVAAGSGREEPEVAGLRDDPGLWLLLHLRPV